MEQESKNIVDFALELLYDEMKIELSAGEVYAYKGIENDYGHIGFGVTNSSFLISDLKVEND